MPDTPEFSEAKRILLEKYLRGERLQPTTPVNNTARSAKADVISPQESVIAIQTSGSKKPFFFLQGDWINGAYWCFPLAHKLGMDQPFYVLEPYKFENLEGLPTFEAIATTHLKSLQSIQPQGPYLLGGFCNGGLLAYEMARQLHEQGQKVDLLILIDPMGLVYSFRNRFVHSLIGRLGDLMRFNPKKQLTYFIWSRHLYRYLQHGYRYLRFSRYRRLKAERVNPHGDILLALKTQHELWLDQQSRYLRSDEQSGLKRRQNTVKFALPKLDALFPEPIFPSAQTIRQDYPAIYDWIAMRYLPPNLYPGKITFLWDTGDFIRNREWHKVTEANEVEVHVIPGRQSSWKTKNLHVLAEHLHICLSKVQVGTEH
jgi:Thioesterase domain